MPSIRNYATVKLTIIENHILI